MNWNSLRSHNGSPQAAFEEICCQLASFEGLYGARFVRKGTPDAGVECFWIASNGDEYAWQAKFFSSASETDWGQLDRSVRTALDKHPRLTAYTVCLPFDRPDARNEGERSFLQKWDDHVIKWQGWAREKGMEVQFPYWGDYELSLRLSREEHRGRVYFWFGEERFSSEWFRQRLEEVIAKAGDRYTPQLDVQLPISRSFDAIGRSASWRRRLQERRGRIKDKVSKSSSGLASAAAPTEFDAINRNAQTLDDLLTAASLNGQPSPESEASNQQESRLTPIDWTTIAAVSQALAQAASAYNVRLLQIETQARQDTIPDSPPVTPDSFSSDDTAAPSESLSSETKRSVSQSSRNVDFSYSRHFLRNLIDELDELDEWIVSDVAMFANVAALLLCGEAGRGKTHLFCDIAERRIGEALPTVLLLAQDFGAGEPWGQILAHLGLSCSPDEFLGALNAAGQASGGRALLIIDALNETTDKSLWRRNLAAMLTKTARYPHIAVALSVRQSYIDLMVPTTITDDKLRRITHEGFAGHEHRAAARFFTYYGIQAPSVPLLTPEFSAPLFLKLFCEGLKKRRMTQVPRGLRGRTTVFRFLVDAVNQRLSEPERLDYDERRNLVEEALRTLARQMSINGRAWLTLKETQALLSDLFRTAGYQNSLYRHLVAESLLNEDNVLLTPDEFAGLGVTDDAFSDDTFAGTRRNLEVVRFAYEKMGDHFAADEWLSSVGTDEASLVAAFGVGGPLSVLRTDGRQVYQRAGFLEALAVLLPESAKRELPDLLPEIKEEYPLRAAFLESILWRRQDAFSERTMELVNKLLISEANFWSRFYRVWLTLAGLPDHPYNANLLHRNLLPVDMPFRDSEWSIWLNEEYRDEASPVRRLVEWASLPDDKSGIEDEAVRLCAIAIAWMLTTPNRFLRDRATKALVRLLQDRLSVLELWLNEFWTVDDPYVLERVLAVTCGCVMRSPSDAPEVTPIAQQVYNQFFAAGRPPFHLLSRDYARMIVEVALQRGLPVSIDDSKIRPPYGSLAEDVWPTMPTEAEVEVLREPTDDDLPPAIDPNTGQPKSQVWRDSERETARRGRSAIFFSALDWGDFHRYVIERRAGDQHWSGRRLTNPPLSQIIATWEATLTPAQKRLYKKVTESRAGIAAIIKNEQKLRQLLETTDPSDFPAWMQNNPDLVASLTSREPTIWADFQSLFDGADEALRRKLSDGQRELFGNQIQPALIAAQGDSIVDENIKMEHQPLGRWIVQRVFELGWTYRRFGLYDSSVDRLNDGRSAHKSERMGKKYQWIALYELMARESDTFFLRDQRGGLRGVLSRYDGPWQCSSRDIDPTWLPAETGWRAYDDHVTRWWAPVNYDAWAQESDALTWLQDATDVPSPTSLIEVTRPSDNSQWLVLDTSVRYQESTPPGEDRFEHTRRELQLWLNAYFVRRSQIGRWWRWAQSQWFTGGWMPEPSTLYKLFWFEYFDSPAYKDRDHPYYRMAWTDDAAWYKEMPCNVLVASQNHFIENSGFDCSVDNDVKVIMPNSLIAQQAGWLVARQEGSFVNEAGQIVAFDPSVTERGYGALLVRRDVVEAFLREHDLSLVWTMAGEKRVHGPLLRDDYIGHLAISGIARWKGSNLEIQGQAQFEAPPT